MAETMSTPTVQASWSTIGRTIDAHLGQSPTAQEVFELGNALSNAFQSASAPGRQQSSLSGGGDVWERLLVWYLNLVAFGTDVVATRKNAKWLPRHIQDAVRVTIYGKQANTESDVAVFSVPADALGSSAPPGDRARHFPSLQHLDAAIERNPSRTELAVLQCKTNWNDNAQIPMLWDLLYQTLPRTRISGVSVGSNGMNVGHFGRFSYSFATVPSNDRTKIKPTSLQVARLAGLSGGVYWGWPTKSGVALGFADFLTQQFGQYFSGGVRSHIANTMTNQPDLVRNFVECRFEQS